MTIRSEAEITDKERGLDAGQFLGRGTHVKLDLYTYDDDVSYQDKTNTPFPFFKGESFA